MYCAAAKLKKAHSTYVIAESIGSNLVIGFARKRPALSKHSGLYTPHLCLLPKTVP